MPFGAYFTVSGIPCFQCSKTKSMLHTNSSTVVSSEAVKSAKAQAPQAQCEHGRQKYNHNIVLAEKSNI